MKQENNAIAQLLKAHGPQVLQDWLKEVATSATGPQSASAQADASGLLQAFDAGVQGGGDMARLDDASWAALRNLLGNLSRSRAAQGSSASETSQFVLSFKRPLFMAMQKQLADKPAEMVAATWALSSIVDQMAQHTMATYQRTREEVIARQQEELLELSTPVVKLWDGVLATPMIGTLDSARTQLVMEALLQRIVETGAEIAIIDITGVPTVDTLVAQHLLKTVTAIRLMGADCIVSGVRPQIAQTIVHLGIDLQGVTTKATLADALSLALKKLGYTVSRNKV
ncbi:STAS domain-containing protein [Piscinibacter gummiphilus]|uniref:STAS domain-containing protein n=1 Tax=Piscinibacter gummiphilus TaxID=946333 RepID=A0ABZ0CLX9_9BURK|nr:STAS domain-containing protein [Piscinibacter gummiphilus]WOB05987.1 STAS domain-containing protein [Piscinibacter gummiphilus]